MSSVKYGAHTTFGRLYTSISRSQSTPSKAGLGMGYPREESCVLIRAGGTIRAYGSAAPTTPSTARSTHGGSGCASRLKARS